MAQASLNAAASDPQRAGLEDIMLSVRNLARQARGLSEGVAGLAERELAMALSVAEQLRDKVIAREALEEARSVELMARLREDAHRAVDLAMDAASTAYVFGTQFFETFVDQPRKRAGVDRGEALGSS